MFSCAKQHLFVKDLFILFAITFKLSGAGFGKKEN
jgi:hypothetical protein